MEELWSLDETSFENLKYVHKRIIEEGSMYIYYDTMYHHFADPSMV